MLIWNLLKIMENFEQHENMNMQEDERISNMPGNLDDDQKRKLREELHFFKERHDIA
jgi:hypothetical protein